MFSNVRLLTMEENSFGAVNAKKNPTENQFIQRMPCSILKVWAPPANFHPPILLIKSNEVIVCLDGHFIVTLPPNSHFKKFVLTTHSLPPH